MQNTKNYLLLLSGFINGLAIMLSGGSLNFWLASKSVNKFIIGFFSLSALPYVLNFLWAPLFDKIINYSTNYLAYFLLLMQIFLSIAVYNLGYYINLGDIKTIAFYAIGVAFLGAAQDTAWGALRSAMSNQKNISNIYVLGYRLGMLIAGPCAIYYTDIYSWQVIYKFFAYLIFATSFVKFIILYRNIYLSKEKIITNNILSRTEKFSNLFEHIGNYRLVMIVLLFLILYKLPDHILVPMLNSFLLDIGFTAKKVATIGKLWGMIGAIIGTILINYIFKHDTTIKALFQLGLIHSLASLLFILVNQYGTNDYLLFVIVGIDSITGGMSMALYITFITSLCKGKYRATQYAIFSSMIGFSRAVLPVFSGLIVIILGWNLFFLFISLLIIPALLLIIFIKDKITINKQ